MQQPPDLTQILATLRRFLPTLARQYHVQSLGVFGSYVRHTQRPSSDLDVLVTFEEPAGLLTFLALENYLTDVLGVKVDLVMREALKPSIGEHVLRELVPEGGHQMAQVDWYIEGVEFSNCNCDYACPCQFESRRPTYGDCRGFAAVRIDKGHFGDVALDGLGAALLYAWPGPIYEGNGECQAVIDARADGRQRHALATILYGGETDAGATHWWVYRTMSRTVHPPLFTPIEFDVHIERRRARIILPGILESTARPIRSPATGAEHRVRIDLPHGIEFDLAEIGSGTTKTTASIALDLKDTYCHFTFLRQSGQGVVR